MGHAELQRDDDRGAQGGQSRGVAAPGHERKADCEHCVGRCLGNRISKYQERRIERRISNDICPYAQPVWSDARVIAHPTLEIRYTERERRAGRDDRPIRRKPEEIPSGKLNLRDKEVVIRRQIERRGEGDVESYLLTSYRAFAAAPYADAIDDGIGDGKAVLQRRCDELKTTPALPRVERIVRGRVDARRDVTGRRILRVLGKYTVDLDHDFADISVGRHQAGEGRAGDTGPR